MWLKYFESIITCSSVGKSSRNSDIIDAPLKVKSIKLPRYQIIEIDATLFMHGIFTGMFIKVCGIDG
jgi:hypothetical protein